MRTKLTLKATNNENLRTTKFMRDMEPLEACVIADKTSAYDGHLVLRTSSTKKIEVINLVTLRPDQCWTQQEGEETWGGLRVRELLPGEEYTLTISRAIVPKGRLEIVDEALHFFQK